MSKVENPGSSSPASTTFSSAMLMRSAGRFFAAASLRIDCSTIPGALSWPYVTPACLRTRPRRCLAVRSTRYAGSVPSGSSTARRTKSTTSPGRAPAPGNTPLRRYDFSISSSASRCSSQSVASAAHSSSSRLGEKNRCSSCAVISRLNRGIRGPLNRCHNPPQAPDDAQPSVRFSRRLPRGRVMDTMSPGVSSSMRCHRPRGTMTAFPAASSISSSSSSGCSGRR